MTKMMTATSWYELNMDIYKQNKTLFNERRLNRDIMSALSDNSDHIGIFTTLSSNREVGFKSFEDSYDAFKSQDCDVEYCAYLHYFTARQNKVKAMEFYHKLQNNWTDLMEQAEKDGDGEYLKICDEAKEAYDQRVKAFALMEESGWWEMRRNGKKIYKTL